MRILIEEYQYDVSVVRELLHGIDALQNVEGMVSVHYVGYFYNTLLHDCVFILPKVLLKESSDGKEQVFGRYAPEDLLDLSVCNPLEKAERDFLYKFAVWVYRAIVVYKNSKGADSQIVYHSRIAQVGSGRRRLSNTYLDILLSLVQFARDNQPFFFFVLKSLHSGYNKIHWRRTIATSTAFVQSGMPVYLHPVNRKRQVNFDEELLVIYFSILAYISDHYGFDIPRVFNIDIITGHRFDKWLSGYGTRRLLEIKYKYFSDKALAMWRLCYAFFDETRRVMVSTDQREYLLVKSFYIVFEAIVDRLVGDDPLPDGMKKEQDDGKVVDHMYTAKSLVAPPDDNQTKTYYIGDSKYYKMGHELGREAVYKQYTYARNVIQQNLDLWGDATRRRDPSVRLRDDDTEGYNVIPNFFISAKLNPDFDYGKDDLSRTTRDNGHYMQYHFENRLFDRDTLLLFHYDINFLFVLALYARDNELAQRKWKEKIRGKFREEIQEWLKEQYTFYAMRAHADVDGSRYVREHFHDVLGKVYTPFDDDTVYSLALDKNERFHVANEALLAQLGEAFHIVECELGHNPFEALEEAASGGYVPQPDAGNDVLLGYWQGIREKCMENKMYYVHIGSVKGSIRLLPGCEHCRYLALYTHDEVELFRVKDEGLQLYTVADMRSKGFTPSGNDTDMLLVFSFSSRGAKKCTDESKINKLVHFTNMAPRFVKWAEVEELFE